VAFVVTYIMVTLEMRRLTQAHRENSLGEMASQPSIEN
jgi:hypothetical protein